MPPTTAGHQTTLSYLWEKDADDNPDFLATVMEDSDHKPFGANARLTTRSGANNAVRTFDPGSREASEAIEQEFTGSWTVEFELTNPWFLQGVLGHEVTDDGGAAATTYNFDGNVPYPFRIYTGNRATGNEEILKGAVASSFSVSISTAGNAVCSLDGAYADSIVSSGGVTTQPDRTNRPLTYASASVQREGELFSLTQNAQISIENNVDMIQELGSRVATAYSPKARVVNLQYDKIVQNSDELNRFYGGGNSPQSTVENETEVVLTFDNGLSGSDQRLIKWTLKDTLSTSYDRTGIGDPQSDLEESLQDIVPSVSATAIVSESIR